VEPSSASLPTTSRLTIIKIRLALIGQISINHHLITPKPRSRPRAVDCSVTAKGDDLSAPGTVARPRARALAKAPRGRQRSA
jgi:hypothetical protein